jgi:hypothetical protein
MAKHFLAAALLCFPPMLLGQEAPSPDECARSSGKLVSENAESNPPSQSEPPSTTTPRRNRTPERLEAEKRELEEAARFLEGIADGAATPTMLSIVTRSESRRIEKHFPNGLPGSRPTASPLPPTSENSVLNPAIEELIDKAKASSLGRTDLAHLILKLRARRFNEVGVARKLNERRVPPPEGHREWDASLVNVLKLELANKIFEKFPIDTLKSRGTQTELMAKLNEEGFSHRDIAILLNERRVPTPELRQWNHASVRLRILGHKKQSFVRSRVPEQTDWHGRLSPSEANRWVKSIRSGKDAKNLTPIEVIKKLRRHRWTANQISKFLNKAFTRSHGESKKWSKRLVVDAIRQSQKNVIREFLEIPATSLTDATLRSWAIELDSFAIPPREIAPLFQFRAPELGSAFNEAAITLIVTEEAKREKPE